MNTPSPNSPDAGQIVNSRWLAAEPSAVFAAFRDPVRLAAWWGPHGFTNSFGEFDFRPGGVWRFTMRGPDGNSYPMDHRFLEIVADARIVIRHVQSGHDFMLAITLTPERDGTRVDWRMGFDDPVETERLRAFLIGANEQNLDRLSTEVTGAAGRATSP